MTCVFDIQLRLQYLQGIETGTEPFTGSAELLTNSYSVTVNT